MDVYWWGWRWGGVSRDNRLFYLELSLQPEKLTTDNDELYISRTYEAVAFEMKYLMNELYSENSQYIEDC